MHKGRFRFPTLDYKLSCKKRDTDDPIKYQIIVRFLKSKGKGVIKIDNLEGSEVTLDKEYHPNNIARAYTKNDSLSSRQLGHRVDAHMVYLIDDRVPSEKQTHACILFTEVSARSPGIVRCLVFDGEDENAKTGKSERWELMQKIGVFSKLNEYMRQLYGSNNVFRWKIVKGCNPQSRSEHLVNDDRSTGFCSSWSILSAHLVAHLVGNGKDLIEAFDSIRFIYESMNGTECRKLIKSYASKMYNVLIKSPTATRRCRQSQKIDHHTMNKVHAVSKEILRSHGHDRA